MIDPLLKNHADMMLAVEAGYDYAPNIAQDMADRIEKLEAEVAALRASLKVLDNQPDITVAEHVEICAFLGAHLPQAAAITKGQADVD